MKKLILSILISICAFVGYAQSVPNVAFPTTEPSPDAYAVNITNYGTSYNNKIAFVEFRTPNSGPATINITPSGGSALGAKPMRIFDGSDWVPLSSGDIPGDTVMWELHYHIASGTMQISKQGAGTGGGGGSVSSVFSRTGAVTATSGDYTATQITNTPAGNIAATTAQTALNELDTEKQSTLVSGTNIKTVNGSTLLGSGDLSITTSQRYSYAPVIYTANHTLAFADTIKTIVMNATSGDLELHVPADATTDFSHGQLIPIIFFGNNDLTVVSDGASFVSSTSGSLVIAASADTVYLTLQKYNTNSWVLAAPSAGGGGAGDVTKVGTPANNQVGVWTGDGTIEGASSLTYDGSNFQLTGDIGSTGTRITKGWFTDLQVTNAIAGSITGNAATVTTNANLTGDVTSSGNATTLATVNGNVGSFGSATAAGTFTVNAKGLITAAGSTTVTPAVGSITGLGTGVGTALAVNVGSAGAPVLFNGALGTPSDNTVWKVGGNTLTGDAVLGGSSGAFGVNLQTNGTTRHAISSTGTHAFTQTAQAGANDFTTFTQAAHTSGIPRGLVYTAGALTGSTASTNHIDWLLDFSASITKPAGNYALNTTIDILPRTITSASAPIITDAVTLRIGAPILGGTALFTNKHSIFSTSGWITASQSAATTEGFRVVQSSNVAIWNFGTSNTMRLTSTSNMNIGPTSSGIMQLTSARSISYQTDANQVTIANNFLSTNTVSTANKTFASFANTWTTVPAGDNKLIVLTPDFVETGAVASNYHALDVLGTLNFGASPTGNYYGLRIHPTITGGTLNSVIGYGVIVDSPLMKNGFGTATPTESMHVVGNALVTGNTTLSTAGSGVLIKEGSNATMGTATLSAGTVTVNTTKVTANSRIFLTVQSLGTVAVATPIAVTARTAATSFTITSSSVTDTSVVAWIIFEPAP